MKKIFLVWAGDKEETTRMIEELRRNKCEVMYLWSDEKKDLEIPGVVYHNMVAMRRGIPALGINMNSFPPPGVALLEKLYKTESLVLTMMNRRVEYGGHVMVVDEKKRLYYDLVRYLQGILNLFKPDAIVFPYFPHGPFPLILYSLARLMRIPTILLWEAACTSDRVLVSYRYDEISPLLAEALQRNRGKMFSVSDLNPDLQRFYNQQTGPEQDEVPFYVESLKREIDDMKSVRAKIKMILKSIRDGTFFIKIYDYIARRFKSDLRKEYLSVVTENPDFNKPFVYVTLHWQPEGTTSPIGEMFVDQLLMIETLSYALPEGWMLYVKEHPFQWSMSGVVKYTNMRYEGYYKKIATLKNVILVPTNINSYHLINASKAVVAVTGTSTYEAVFRNKPGIVFGYPWFKDVPGIFKVDGHDSCKEVLAEIKDGFTVDQGKILNYLKSFDEATFHAYIGPIGGREAVISREESVKNVIHAILKELKKIV